MAWIVTEEELENAYLSLDTYGGAYEFSESSLEIGYVSLGGLCEYPLAEN